MLRRPPYVALEEPGYMFGDDDSPSASMSGSYDSSDPRGVNSRGPRVSFLIVPSDKAGPNPQTSAWQYFVAIALFGLTAGSALQLGLVAEVSRLPQATMDWLAAGSQGLETTLAPGELPPGGGRSIIRTTIFLHLTAHAPRLDSSLCLLLYAVNQPPV